MVRSRRTRSSGPARHPLTAGHSGDREELPGLDLELEPMEILASGELWTYRSDLDSLAKA